MSVLSSMSERRRAELARMADYAARRARVVEYLRAGVPLAEVGREFGVSYKSLRLMLIKHYPKLWAQRQQLRAGCSQQAAE
jgi:hypothetical protein